MDLFEIQEFKLLPTSECVAKCISDGVKITLARNGIETTSGHIIEDFILYRKLTHLNQDDDPLWYFMGGEVCSVYRDLPEYIPCSDLYDALVQIENMVQQHL